MTDKIIDCNVGTALARRDELLRKLWCVYRDISDKIAIEDFTDEDLKVWDSVTSHSAIQSQLVCESSLEQNNEINMEV